MEVRVARWGGWALAVAAGASLGCAGLLARPTARFEGVSADACGVVRGEAVAAGPEAELSLWRDGSEVWAERGAGERRRLVQVEAAPGAVELELRLDGEPVASESLRLGPRPLQVAAVQAGEALAEQAGKLEISVSGCVGGPPVHWWLEDADGRELASGEVAPGASVVAEVPGRPAGTDTLLLTWKDGELLPESRPVVWTARALTSAELARMDHDRDGFRALAFGGDDCDDERASVNPGREEAPTPNGIDDNCDGRVDEGTVAFDDDGDGYSEQQGDCRDSDPGVFPGAVEHQDCRDEDCDGEIDEGAVAERHLDVYEPNDERERAADLNPTRAGSFRKRVELVSRGPEDAEWFRFYSEDGFWDVWGIGVEAARVPDTGRWDVTLYRQEKPRKSATLREGQGMNVANLPLFGDGTDDWWLVLRPVGVPPGCPAVFEVWGG